MGVESSDEELAAGVDEEAELLGSLCYEDWLYVVRAEMRGELLEVASVEGWPGVVRFVVNLAAKVREAQSRGREVKIMRPSGGFGAGMLQRGSSNGVHGSDAC